MHSHGLLLPGRSIGITAPKADGVRARGQTSSRAHATQALVRASLRRHAISVLAMGLVSCGGQQLGPECMDLPCGPMAAVRIRSPEAGWPAGWYELYVDADESSHYCFVRLMPKIYGLSKYVVAFDCAGTLTAWFRPDADAKVTAAALRSPLRGPFEIVFRLPIGPHRVQLHLYRDGRRVLGADDVVDYRVTHPLGPGCPECRAAVLVLDAPSSHAAR